MALDIKLSNNLLDRLPRVRGQMHGNQGLAKFNWFRVGGAAEVLFRPKDEFDLLEFLKNLPRELPVTVLGVGSNTLIRDGGVRGICIRLGSNFRGIEIRGNSISVGAGLPNLKLANIARDAGISGMEFLSGIPGSIGGSIKMNAGAFGSEVKNILVEVVAISRFGQRMVLSSEKLGLGYRSSDPPDGCIFVKAKLKGVYGDINEIEKKMDMIQNKRKLTQPIRQATGGSTFKNPPGYKAWELIERAGCRGLKVGGAQISEKHCNFLINLGDATAKDIEALGEEVRRRVYFDAGVELDWEIQRIGVENDVDGVNS